MSATVVAVYKLTRKDLQGAAERVDRNNRKATWTVVILSTLFFVFNCILLGVTATVLNFLRYTLRYVGKLQLFFSLTFFGVFFAIPLNSTINPIVYLVRKSDMRRFFKQHVQKLFHFGQ